MLTTMAICPLNPLNPLASRTINLYVARGSAHADRFAPGTSTAESTSIPYKTEIIAGNKDWIMMLKMAELYRHLIASVGENPDREGLQKTPERAAKAFQFLTKGYHEDISAIINNALFSSDTTEMVVVKNIELYSMCEHHLLPFIGKAHVGYIPNGKVIGLSKVARVVDAFGRRLQIQENLTRQIGEAIQLHTKALGTAVVIEAQHLCMMMRGVEKQNSVMTTSYLVGEFHDDPATRAEFFKLIDK
jgi:GTP cyclohydrolase I